MFRTEKVCHSQFMPLFQFTFFFLQVVFTSEILHFSMILGVTITFWKKNNVCTWDRRSEGTITHHHAGPNQHKVGDDRLRNDTSFQELEHPRLQAALLAVELEVGIRCQPCHRHRHPLPGEIHMLTQERVQGKCTTCTDAIRQLICTAYHNIIVSHYLYSLALEYHTSRGNCK